MTSKLVVLEVNHKTTGATAVRLLFLNYAWISADDRDAGKVNTLHELVFVVCNRSTWYRTRPAFSWG